LRKILHRIFLGINIFFAVTLLISYLAVHINPEDFAFPAYFGLAYPYLLLINIVFAVIWAVNLKYEALISVLVIALGITHLSNYIKFRKPKNEKPGTFQVLSYNVRLFNYFEIPKVAGSENKILALIKSHNLSPGVIYKRGCFKKRFRNNAGPWWQVLLA
jgi:hypothetical protein